MAIGRRLGTLVATAAVTALCCPVVGSGPANAHGAATEPVSRAAACGPEGGRAAGSAACRAAARAGIVRDEWDNIRIPDVAGRDRAVIPDGRLCSAGLDRYRGLDLARADWPSTRLTPGTAHTFAYRTTIAHEGEFRWYVTVDGYNPTRPLTWSDLEREPFLRATDPPLRDGAYRMAGRLPRDKVGRHVIYTIWRNTSTPDTYYSCSDVVFAAAAEPTATSAAPPVGSAASTAPSPVGAEPGGQVVAAGDRSGSGDDTSATGRWLPVAATSSVAVLAVALAVLLTRRRRARVNGSIGRHR
ncbi:lytic polysaccharide monooxygenase [Solwaraspora sp. WMMD1047]|uniref:lytic polysaccharide monooxygenase auxiliary activity family 9 protein n=1 Tax=Solwaraspora sp. WMMD1047 TaxID=3016102 RepID=UPI002417AB8B|nr:lytic polysaccharide monooxygenase [Solwaraspora sp. WMMD1047]MDG4830892.1 lytic polysaccharide monooxygenase [Solwaraspora sp. WMMD1047]